MRLFIAIDLSDSVRASLSDQIDKLDSILHTRSIRWVKPSGIHLTLKFLGETPEEKVNELKDALSGIARRFSPFMLHIGSLGCFPNVRKPRVVWMGIEENTGSLNRLHKEIEMECRQLGFKAENRPFRAHLTLGRIKKPLSSDSREILFEQVGKESLGNPITEPAKEISLIRSFLRPTGAEYRKLGVFRFSGGE